MTSSIAEPSNLIPYLASDSASAELSRLIFNGLVKYDKDLNLVGDLAQRWEVLDGGLRIVFHLRPNVRWQDGEPFTADDVEYTFNTILDPNTPTPYSGDFEKVRSLKVIDPLTIEVLYKEPFSPGLASWGMGIVPKHAKLSARSVVGTGPYRLKRWITGERVELEAFDGYFEGRPFIDRYVYRIIPDSATTFLELETENIDAAGLTPLQFARQTGTPAFTARFNKFRYPSFGYTYVGYNHENSLFKDARVRNALGLAANKGEIIDATLLGLGRVTTGPFLPDSWAYNNDVKPAVFDPGRARQLLSQAGWKDLNGDGILEKDGRAFSFVLMTNQGNDARRQACEILQRQWRQVGVEVKVQVVEWSVFLKEYIDKKRFDAVLLAWNLTPDPDCFDIFHSSKTAPGQFNFVSYRNAEVDALLEKARRVFDQSERAELYHKAHALISADEPYSFLYAADALAVVHRRFLGVELSPSGLMHNFIRWNVPESQRRYRR